MLDQTPKIPNYEIISPLGSGTSGQVWLAKDRFGERRAIKITHIDHISSSDYQRRFRREVRAQQQLYEVSSHVARIFDYDEKHIPPYIVMDYINGMDLNRMIAIGEMDDVDLQTRLHWIEAIASTLTKAHSIKIPGDSHGIIHRDIKPQNIRIQGQRPYLLDFSISLTSDVEIDSTQDAMTLRYVAPEVIPSEASDIFSFGLVAFEILYEVHPITTYDEASKIMMSDYINYVQHKLQKISWRLPSTIDARFPSMNLQANRRKLDMVFQKVLSLEPSYRFETPKQFSDALLSILLGPPSSQEFQIYTSKTTTETPQVTLHLDENSPLGDHQRQKRKSIPVDVAATPQDTRRFASKEIDSWTQEDHDVAVEVESDEDLSVEGEPIPDTKPSAQRPLIDEREDKVMQRDLETIQLDWTDPDSDGLDESEGHKPKRKRSDHKRLSYAVLGILIILAGLTALMRISGGDGASSLQVINTENAGDLDTDGGVPVSETVSDPRVAAAVSSTETATPTLTRTPSQTPEPTATVTDTAVPTNTPRPTRTATLTATPTATATSTNTPTATVTRRASSTPTMTYTVQPTSTPTSTPQAWEIEQRILTVDDIRSTINMMFMPSGCSAGLQGEVICLEQSVHIDLEPVSNEKYDLCLRGTLCTRPAFGEVYDPAGAGANNPVVGVNMMMAQTYCEWRGGRLPIALEWQMLVAKFPEMYQDVNEWIEVPDSPAGQSQIYIRDESDMRRVWLEDSYLSDDLSFRCVQPD